MNKPRVHELALEFGVTSKEVLAKLRDMGEFAKAASSTIEPRAAQRLRDSYARSGQAIPTDGRGGTRSAEPQALVRRAS